MSGNVLKKQFNEKDIQRVRNLVKGKSGERITHGVGYIKEVEDHIDGDTWIENGVKSLCDSISPSILAVFLEDCSRYGSLKFDKNFKVNSFEEKSSNLSNKSYINAGLMKLSPHIFENIKVKRFSVERDILPKLVSKGLLSVKPVETFFVDIGIPEDYIFFCKKQSEINLI